MEIFETGEAILMNVWTSLEIMLIPMQVHDVIRVVSAVVYRTEAVQKQFSEFAVVQHSLSLSLCIPPLCHSTPAIRFHSLHRRELL